MDEDWGRGRLARGTNISSLHRPYQILYILAVESRKPILWLSEIIKTPPFSEKARREAGFILGRLQDGAMLGLPHLRPMPSIARIVMRYG